MKGRQLEPRLHLMGFRWHICKTTKKGQSQSHWLKPLPAFLPVVRLTKLISLLNARQCGKMCWCVLFPPPLTHPHINNKNNNNQPELPTRKKKKALIKLPDNFGSTLIHLSPNNG